jgi:hypothetical protein
MNFELCSNVVIKNFTAKNIDCGAQTCFLFQNSPVLIQFQDSSIDTISIGDANLIEISFCVAIKIDNCVFSNVILGS